MPNVPGYWINEVSGVLRPAIEAYLKAVTEPDAPEMTGEQIAAVRAYFRQWIEVGNWHGPMIDVLRTQVNELTTSRDITRWLDRAMDEGIDPL